MRSQQSVLAFLAGHFRYNTMSSCNQSTSFAHCVKIHKLSLESDSRIQAFDLENGRGAADTAAHALLDVNDVWSEYGENEVYDFTEAMGGNYTIGSNGRSGGYLVLYNSYKKESEYKSQCRSCGQRNYKTVPDLSLTPNANACGRCHAVGEKGRHNFTNPLVTLQTWPGRPIGEDLEDMTFSQLKSLAKVVLAFDATCMQIRDNFIEMVLSFQVEDEVIMVPKTVKVLTERSREMAST